MTEPTLADPGEPEPVPGPNPRDEFATLFADAYRVLWFIAVGIVGNRSLAEDVVQEAAAIGFGKFDQFQRGTNFTAWMGQMVRHVALNLRRKENRKLDAAADVTSIRRPSSPSDNNSAGSDGSDLDAVARLAAGQLPPDHGEFDDQLVRAMEALSPAARACLLLRTLGDMDYKGISRLLGIPEATAMSHVHRARNQLRERLATKGNTSRSIKGQARLTRESETPSE